MSLYRFSVGFARIILPYKMFANIRSLKLHLERRRIVGSPFFKRFSPKIDPLMLNSRSIYSDRYSYVYFRIPKAANSTVVASLIANEKGGNLSRDLVEKYKSSRKKLSSISDAKIRNIEEGTFFTFTFVRNPYTRVYSAYLDKIKRKKAESELVYSRLRKDKSEDITFSEFIFYLEMGGINENPHWARQVDMISIPVNLLQFVGKVEEIGKDLETVMKRLYGSNAKVSDFRPHKTEADEVFNDISDADLKRLHALYKEDFHCFGYDQHYGKDHDRD